jgi:hypothetical protein
MSPKEITENDIIKAIDSQIFFKELKLNNLSLEVFFADLKNLKRTDIELLNTVITNCKEKYNLTVTNCMLILEQYLMDFKRISELLSDKN